MNFLKKIGAGLLVFTQLSMLHAEWNPFYLSNSENSLEALKDPTLISLENKVFEYVKNSWCSQEKAKLLLELIAITHPKICVEIGAFTGSSTLPILAGLQHVGDGKAYIVEAWSNEEAIRGLPGDDPNAIWWASLNMEAVKNQFFYMIEAWSLHSTFHTLNTSSEQAASQIPAIDFLHLDGNFSETGALLDSELYVTKVVPGGYILLSNALVMIGGKATKMKALWPLFEYCDIICEIDQGNALLFRKN